ncbi:MAG: CopG family transcriptional regulator [Candidatus Thioglobus sp.]|uniref:CopG family transcriptional regulator n=1 Tax=Candidatus Thioglobus sp. TaxID=2026721 RepID=UPI00260DF0A6|nr:CopG family transcriptional regulator [Candidatus Thioglobus sp.]MDC9727646.1 CopG family transcriptional regulator [Candidatus Thioglobus sp.]
MGELSKRSTVYFEENLHQALKIKAAISHQSVSEMVNEAVRHLLNEDQEDILSFNQRESEPVVSYETLLDELKADGKI